MKTRHHRLIVLGFTGLVYVSPNRIEKRVYTGMVLASGGQATKSTDAQFTRLFHKNAHTSVAAQILGALPMDCMPLKVLDTVAAFQTLKPLPPFKNNIRAQNPVWETSKAGDQTAACGTGHLFSGAAGAGYKPEGD